MATSRADGRRELRFTLAPGDHLLGAAPECAVHLPDPTVSRRHAYLHLGADGGASLEDLGSRNGCWAGERRLEGLHRLAEGEQVRLGEVALSLQAIPDDESECVVPGLAPPVTDPPPAVPTLATAPRLRFCATTLPDLLAQAAAGESWTRVAANGLRAIVAGGASGAVIEQSGAVIAEVGSMCGVGSAVATGAFGTRAVEDLVVRVHAHDSSATTALAPLAEVLLDVLRLCRRPTPSARRKDASGAGEPVPPSAESRHPGMAELYRQARIVARSRLSVLIEGESGTGKELFARFLHTHSGLPDERFVALNCAALPRDLLDAELFGIEAGVATGVVARAGKFELAHGGTLFLDEVADMAPETQARLLRVLQEGQVYRLGGQQARSARVRVLAACNRSLEALVCQGAFRLDLYHRIADWTARLPPLRDRGEDIGLLAAEFLERECRARGIGYAGITRAALDCMNAYAWPGNVRELEREMMRVALFLNAGEAVDSSLLKPALRSARAGGQASLQAQLDAHERRIIEAALRASGGQVQQAAARLGVGKSTLYRRIEALGLR